MPAYHVTRSIKIAAPAAIIRTSLCDFTQWPHWSPWLVIEPDADLDYSNQQGKVGAKYSWEGHLIGSGTLELHETSENLLGMQLNLLTPFKSKARVTFDIEEQGTETKVTWNIYGKASLFIFFMRDKIETYLGMDYERGLSMLKQYIEEGFVSSSLSIDGVTQQDGLHYVGITDKCSLDAIDSKMRDAFTLLYGFLKKNELPMNVVPFTIYHTFDIEAKHSQFTVAVPVSLHVKVHAPFVKGETQTTDIIKVTHTGRHPYLANAWSAAIRYSHTNNIYTQKTPIGIEYYLNAPTHTPADELVTVIAVPVK